MPEQSTFSLTEMDYDGGFIFPGNEKDILGLSESEFDLENLVSEINEYLISYSALTPVQKGFDWSDSDITSQIDILLECLQRNKILIPNLTKVRDYLASHPNLGGKIPAVYRWITDEFPVDLNLSLEVYSDPEIEDEHLVLFIRQESYDQNILEKIDRVNNKVCDFIKDPSAVIHITTDFSDPM